MMQARQTNPGAPRKGPADEDFAASRCKQSSITCKISCALCFGVLLHSFRLELTSQSSAEVTVSSPLTVRRSTLRGERRLVCHLQTEAPASEPRRRPLMIKCMNGSKSGESKVLTRPQGVGSTPGFGGKGTGGIPSISINP
jgi:hypothetical protein